MTWIVAVISIIVIFIVGRFVYVIIQGYNEPIDREKRKEPYENKNRILHSSQNLKDYYQILQVHPTAEQEIIRAAYDRLAKKYHPDVNQAPSSTKKMTDINEAFEVLGNLERRRSYHPEWLQKRRNDRRFIK
ncbi:DnaJ domain-containing protein [Chloroflexota bacterium]